MSYLLDTNVISEARKPGGNEGVKRWLASARGDELYLSVLVLGEVRQGVERLRRRDPARANVYDAWLTRLSQDYADRLLPITLAVAEEWGRLNSLRPLPVIDSLLAATARVHSLTLVTRNTSDFTGTGVNLLNPFLES